MKLYSLVLAGMLVASTSANSVTVDDAKKFASDAKAFVSTKQFGVGSAVGAVVVGAAALYCMKRHFTPNSQVETRKPKAAKRK